MSLMSKIEQSRRPVRHALLMIALAVVAIASQIAIPWVSYSTAVRFDQEAWGKTKTWDQFLVDRFRFYWLFKPTIQETRPLILQSGVVCGDELIALFATSPLKSEESCQVLRCNLKTGSIDYGKSAPPDVRFVLSDGQQIWWLPAYSSPISPFLWEGRPVALILSKSHGRLVQMIEFVDGKWSETEQFGLRDKFGSMLGPPIRVHQINGRVVTIRASFNQFHYRSDFDFGSAEVVKKSSKPAMRQLFNLTKQPEAVDPEWNKCAVDPTLVVNESGTMVTYMRAMQYDLKNFSNLLFDQNQMWSLNLASRVQLRGGNLEPTFGYLCENLESKDKGRYFIDSPLRWEMDKVYLLRPANVGAIMNLAFNSRGRNNNNGAISVVTGGNDDAYVIHGNRADGRIAVIQIVDRKARLIAQVAEPMEWRCYLDAGMALLMALVLPAFVLVIFARLIERRLSPERLVQQGVSVELASILRRSIARGIDLALLGSGFFLSLALHPGLQAWWTLVLRTIENLQTLDFITPGPRRANLATLQHALPTFVECLSLPADGRMLSLIALVFVLQVIWSGLTGCTIGKWLVGIRTVRTTYRPCGVARSLLRELVLIPESLGLASWWPAVITILSTQDRQRLGDLLADTVVIRKTRIVSKDEFEDCSNTVDTSNHSSHDE